jgi:hypothetical protein
MSGVSASIPKKSRFAESIGRRLVPITTAAFLRAVHFPAISVDVDFDP